MVNKMADTTSQRLDRIENKLDILADAMVMMARTEEKLTALKEAHDKAFQRMNAHSQKLDEIERQVQDNAATVGMINKLFWVAVVAIAGSIAAQLWM
jgi:DNA repair exonuclease SbcCD ATPase subunit